MKALIWFTSFFVAEVLGIATKFLASATSEAFSSDTSRIITTTVLALAYNLLAIPVARALCHNYDKTKLHNKALSDDISEYDYIYEQLPSLLKERLEQHKDKPETVKNLLQNARTDNDITKLEYEILYSHFFPD